MVGVAPLVQHNEVEDNRPTLEDLLGMDRVLEILPPEPLRLRYVGNDDHAWAYGVGQGVTTTGGTDDNKKFVADVYADLVLTDSEDGIGATKAREETYAQFESYADRERVSVEHLGETEGSVVSTTELWGTVTSRWGGTEHSVASCGFHLPWGTLLWEFVWDSDQINLPVSMIADHREWLATETGGSASAPTVSVAPSWVPFHQAETNIGVKVGEEPDVAESLLSNESEVIELNELSDTETDGSTSIMRLEEVRS